jgi:pentatricopeptide repeat protein
VYTRARLLVREGRVVDVLDGRLPAIVYGQAVVGLAKLGAESQTYQTVCDMLEAGWSPTEQTLDNVFLELSRIASHRAAIAILDHLQRFSVRVSTLSLNAVINACAKAGDYNAALALYETRISPQCLDELGASVLVKCCDKLNQPLRAVRVLLQSILANKHVSIALRERVFAILVRSQSAALAVDLLLFLEQYYSQKGLVDDALSVALLVDTTDSEDAPGVEELRIEEGAAMPLIRLPQLLALATPLTQSAGLYAAVVSCLAARRHARASYEMLESYIARGGLETPDMYVSVVSAFKFSRDTEGAEAVFDRLRLRVSNPFLHQSRPLTITIAHYNALLSVYSAAEQLSEHEARIISEVAGLGLAWDTHTYTSLIIGSPPTRVLQLAEDLMLAGVSPTHAALRCAFKAAISEGEGLRGAAIAQYALRLGMHLDSSDLGLVFTSLRQDGLADAALELLLTLHDRGDRVPTGCYSLTLQALEKTGDWKRAISLLLSLSRRGEVLDARTFNLVLSACTRGGEHALALKLFDQIGPLSKGRFRPNESSFSLAVYAAWKQRDAAAALRLLEAILAQEIPLSPRIVTQIIACLEACGQHAACVDVFERVVRSRPIMSEASALSEIDLHGYSIHMAKAAVLSTLFALRDSSHAPLTDLVIITGMNSINFSPFV